MLSNIKSNHEDDPVIEGNVLHIFAMRLPLLRNDGVACRLIYAIRMYPKE